MAEGLKWPEHFNNWEMWNLSLWILWLEADCQFEMVHWKMKPIWTSERPSATLNSQPAERRPNSGYWLCRIGFQMKLFDPVDVEVVDNKIQRSDFIPCMGL